MINASIYEDIGKRAGGDFYLGVVGPVRTGKSTFIKRFMEVMVLPSIAESDAKIRIKDELPQSAEGKTITTTEPKFIPPQSVKIVTSGGADFKVRLVDCVGYLVPGVLGDKENEQDRMVSTPWSSEKMSFAKAAEIGTEKVIKDHSVVGIVVTCDGSFGEIPRSNFEEAESKTINQLKSLKKPFIMILNSAVPDKKQSMELRKKLEEKYNVPVILTDCRRMTEEDFERLFAEMINQFPAQRIDFRLPGYLDAIDDSHWIKSTIIDGVRSWMDSYDTIGEAIGSCCLIADGSVIKKVKVVNADMAKGIVTLEPVLEDGLYYNVIEELMGAPVSNDSQLFNLLKEYSRAKRAFDSIKGALEEVQKTDYGIVAPELCEMVLEKPEIFKQGSKFGVRMKAKAPCLHIIKTDISTEISPVVGTESQSKDLAELLTEQFENNGEDIWETNLFGKSLKEMVTEQMENKVESIPEVLREKIKRSLQKISDEGKDYFICIII